MCSEYMCKEKDNDELTLSIEERKNFQDGRKLVAIIREVYVCLSVPLSSLSLPPPLPSLPPSLPPSIPPSIPLSLSLPLHSLFTLSPLSHSLSLTHKIEKKILPM
jgi:hypothetical protein